MSRHHFHPCSTCTGMVPCDGEWDRNDDAGEWEAICPDYHLPNGEVAEIQCDNCLALDRSRPMKAPDDEVADAQEGEQP